MEIKTKTFKIKCKKPTLDFFEDWFKANNLNVVRYAITDVKDDILNVVVSYLDV